MDPEQSEPPAKKLDKGTSNSAHTSPPELPDLDAEQLGALITGTTAGARPAADQDSAGSLLLVDDDLQHLHSMARLLGSHGFKVRTCAGVRLGLQSLVNSPVDAVVLDLNMPGAGGLDFLETLNEQFRNPPPVLVVSGESRVEQVSPAIRLGAFDFLRKPYDPNELLASVRNAVVQRRLAVDNRAMLSRVEQSDRLHRYLVDQSPDLIYMLDPDGHFTYLNRAAESVFDQPRDQLMRQHWSVLFPETELPRASWHFNERRTGSRATHAQEMQAGAQGDKAVVLEVTAMGVYRGIDSSREQPEFTGTYGVARDVTRSKDTARDLEQTRERFHGLFQSSPDAIFISRASDGKILESNTNFGRLLELIKPADGSHDTLLWPNDIAGALSERERFMARLAQSPGGVLHSLVVGPPNQERLLELNASLISLDGDEGVLATVRDVTEEKRAEADRLLLEQQLQQSRKMEAIGLLAGGIAHDFNNILASMIGYAELAMLPVEKSESNETYMREVVSAGQRARDLIAQLLAFSRGNRGEVRPVDVGRAATGVMRMLRAAVPSRIAINMTAETVPAVAVDPVNLQQVIINLMVNARDAIEGTGSIEMRLAQDRHIGPCTSCQQHVAGDWVQLSVSDTGRGIDPELLPHVFDLFVSSHAGSRDRGTGMGLSLVHSIVHEAGGHLTVDSVIGQGTVFTLLLPPHADSAVPLTDGEIEPAATGFTNERADGRVLVVDDEVSVCNFLAEALRTRGYSVLVRHDGQAAWEFMREEGAGIDLVVTDQTMPRLSGIEFASKTREIFPTLPIILCTGHRGGLGDDGTLPVNTVLTKPFSVRKLLDLADDLVAKAGPAASRHQA